MHKAVDQLYRELTFLSIDSYLFDLEGNNHAEG